MDKRIKAAQNLYSGLINTYNPDTQDLIWLDGHETTQAQWDAIANETARLNRAEEYPSIGDQLDALFHGNVFPAEMQAKIQEIKDKYPKV
jgi:hypothetical protein